MALFPNVPDVPGVPALLRGALNNAIDEVVLLTTDALGLFGGLDTPQWGLFLNGEPAVVADSVISFDYREDWEISDAPTEEGGFESYNKVQRPFDVRLRFATGGSQADRQDFIQSVQQIIGALDLFDAVTPEATYQSVNPTHWDYSRKADRGAGLLHIDLYCRQVRVTATSQYTSTTDGNPTTTTTAGGSGSGTGTVTRGEDLPNISGPVTFSNTQSPSAAAQVNGGTVQPMTPTAAENASFTKALSEQPFNF
jgi:hypothetical protein